MAVKKIEELNIHRDVNSTEQFDVQGYLNENWDKMQDVVDNNAEELMQVQKDISTLKEDNKTNKSSIDVLEKSNETRDEKISKNTEDIEAIQGSIKTATETINKKDNEQDEDIKANKETIKEIQAENERLRNDIKSIAVVNEVSGENIHIEDSSNARCELEIGGNQKQETREGYNLLNNDDLNLSSKTLQTKRRLKIDANTEYSIVSEKEFTDVAVNAFSDDINYEKLILTKEKQNKQYYYKFTTKSDTQTIFFYVISADEYTNVNDFVNSTKLMLIKGSKATDYEQYGASPSFAYPSPVKSVGNIKNILDMSNAKNGASAGIICTTNADGSYKYKGTATSQYINVWFMGGYATDLPTLFTLEPGTYYINDVSLFEGTTGFANDSSKKIWTFIRAYNVTGVRAPNAVSGNTYDETKYPIIAKIDHEISWFPYDCGYEKIDIFNKNIFKEKANKKDIKKAYINIISGILNIKKGEIYIISFDTNNNQGGLYLNEDIFLFQGQHNITCDGKRHYLIGKAKDNINKNVTILKTLKETTNNYDISNVLVTKYDASNVDTKYIEHQEQSYLVDVQQPMFEGDTFVKQDGKWYEKHCVKTEIMLTFPTTNIEVCGTFANFQINRNIAFAVVKNDLKITNVRNDILCDKLKAKDNSMWGGKEDGIQTYINSNKFMISIPFEDIEKNFGEELTINNYSQAFRKYINDNGPFKIYYLLEEPELVECTEAQNKVLDEIYNKAHTYKNITNISAESAEVNPIICLKYLKDPETEHNKLQAQIDEIKQLLSTTETSAMLLNNMQTDLESEV